MVKPLNLRRTAYDILLLQASLCEQNPLVTVVLFRREMNAAREKDINLK